MKSKRIARLFSGMGVMLLSVSGVNYFHPAEAAAQTIREIAVPGLPGISSVGYRRGELTVEYNPRTCARLGADLCSFFRAHEYGHIALGHLERRTPVRQAEYEADVWAARNSTESARSAAIRYFQSGKGGSIVHGSGQARANRVANAGTATEVRVTRRPDGSRVVRRSYSAISSRPFQNGAVRYVVRRRK